MRIKSEKGGFFHSFILQRLFPRQYAEILTFYTTRRYFHIKQKDEYSDLRQINKRRGD